MIRTLLVVGCLASLGLVGQEKQQIETYKVDFQIREDGAAKPRRYTILTDSAGQGRFRVGTKVAYATALSPTGVPTSYSYMDIGVSINVRARPAAAGKVAMNADVEITSVQAQEKMAPNPSVSNVRTDINAQITPKKPTLVASIEDPSTSKKFDVEVTVTPIE